MLPSISVLHAEKRATLKNWEGPGDEAKPKVRLCFKYTTNASAFIIKTYLPVSESFGPGFTDDLSPTPVARPFDSVYWTTGTSSMVIHSKSGEKEQICSVIKGRTQSCAVECSYSDYWILTKIEIVAGGAL